jgi:hypothetical protein
MLAVFKVDDNALISLKTVPVSSSTKETAFVHRFMIQMT